MCRDCHMVAITSTLQLYIQVCNPAQLLFKCLFSFGPSCALRKRWHFNVKITCSSFVFVGDVCPSLLFPPTPQCLGCHYFFLPPSSLPTIREYWDRFGFYIEKSQTNFFSLQKWLRWLWGQLGRAGNHRRTDAEGWDRLQVRAQDSFLRPSPQVGMGNKMWSRNPTSAIIPLKPNQLYANLHAYLKKGQQMPQELPTIIVLWRCWPWSRCQWCSGMGPKQGTISCSPSHAAAQGPALSSSPLSKDRAPRWGCCLQVPL